MTDMMGDLVLAISAALAVTWGDFFVCSRAYGRVATWAGALSNRPRIAAVAIAISVLLGCGVVSVVRGEAVPRVHDEFSYLLMSNTFASGGLAASTPPERGSFDTFHVLLSPTYASKYPPGQGLVLAIGESLTGRPIAGVWLSAAIALVTLFWMFHSWSGPRTALLGATLGVLTYGTLSYWSHTYWGGMLAAAGGAMCFAALRRLWTQLTCRHTILFGLGAITLVMSRPVEGLTVLAPWVVILAWRQRSRWCWSQHRRPLALLVMTLTLAASWNIYYNTSITGSPWITPYSLYATQYEETPPFVFLPRRELESPRLPLRRVFDTQESRLYDEGRNVSGLLAKSARLITSTVTVFGSFLFVVPFVAALAFRSRAHLVAQCLLVFCIAYCVYLATSTAVRDILTICVVALEVVLLSRLWSGWNRAAGATVALNFLVAVCTKGAFAHYLAPSAALIVWLQVDTLSSLSRVGAAPRTAWQRQIRHVPIALFIGATLTLPWRIITAGEPRHTQFGVLPTDLYLPRQDWSTDRARIKRQLATSGTKHLVFVSYSQFHNVNEEWVYNHSDILDAQIVWARDLGYTTNRRVQSAFDGRQAWFLEADRPHPEPVPYGRDRAFESPVSNGKPSDILPW